MGFLSKLILPRQVDFDHALHVQAEQTTQMIQHVYEAFVAGDLNAQTAIVDAADKARSLKEHNMKELLNVFITPYDKESIFRLITQLDWVAVSTNHLKMIANANSINSLKSDEDILLELTQMATLLNEGISRLSAKNVLSIAENCDRIHDKYDQVVLLCARSSAALLQREDFRKTLVYRDIHAQLKDIAKRIHIAANTLEDMMIKIV